MKSFWCCYSRFRMTSLKAESRPLWLNYNRTILKPDLNKPSYEENGVKLQYHFHTENCSEQDTAKPSNRSTSGRSCPTAAPGRGKPARHGTEPPLKGCQAPVPPVLPRNTGALRNRKTSKICIAQFCSLIQPPER